MAEQALTGKGIVVTRPIHQAEGLTRLIESEGGRAILFPVLEILDAEDLRPLHDLIDRLDQFDIAVFISPNAVRKAMNLIRARRSLPESLQIAAIGRGSTKELRAFGVNDVLAPESRFDSENLLALDAFQNVDGRKIIIFRGDGGREVLGDTLIARGATIEYAECYRRRKPDTNAGALLRHWARNEIDAITVTSSEGLHNLYDMVGKLGQQWLRKTPLFVSHERIAEAAGQMGLERVIVAGPSDDEQCRAVVSWFTEHRT